MKRRILIVQSIPAWLQILTAAIYKEFPDVAANFTDSFDHAVDLARLAAKENARLSVISSDMFHDTDSVYFGLVTKKISENQKDGDMLAKMIKEINPDTKFFVFSGYMPRTKAYIDGYIQKDDRGYEGSLQRVLEVLR